MVGMEMVTLVSSADILGDLGLRTSNKYFGISFIRMKRKGVEYCPVIMRYATVKRAIAQDRCMVTYAQFGQAFLEQMVFTVAAPPPPPSQAKIAQTAMYTPLKRLLCLSKISDAHSDFNAESG